MFVFNPHGVWLKEAACNECFSHWNLLKDPNNWCTKLKTRVCTRWLLCFLDFGYFWWIFCDFFWLRFCFYLSTSVPAERIWCLDYWYIYPLMYLYSDEHIIVGFCWLPFRNMLVLVLINSVCCRFECSCVSRAALTHGMLVRALALVYFPACTALGIINGVWALILCTNCMISFSSCSPHVLKPQRATTLQLPW